ncbi:MAG: molybdopterin-dependent oxidoreductase [Candidatus Tectomicrobia bacterium]|nr:molybdopterin-dependent oxidoreductase [Candidatus Tectomicrobia bacterium]
MDRKRRNFLRTTALVGSAVAVGAKVQQVMTRLAYAAHEQTMGESTFDYAQQHAENRIYSTCLQCHTACQIAAKIVDEVCVKLDGSPYSPQNLLPHIAYETSLQEAAKIDGKLCPKGQAGIETLYDPYRIRKVLKRDGPRGSNRWKTISFEDAIREIVEGGKLFAHLNEQQEVEGLRSIFALRDASQAAALAADIQRLRSRTISLAEFRSKHRDAAEVLIDPNHPDLGPKNNQFVFLAGRIEHGRKEFMNWFTRTSFGSVNTIEHTSICEQSHHIAYGQVTAQPQGKTWKPGLTHLKPDAANAEYILFFGTGAFEANFGPTPMAEKITQGMVDRNLKIDVVDPRLSKTAGKASSWIPIKPGTDGMLALAMASWIISQERFDRRYLENANVAAALADGEPTWTSATYLVKLENDRPSRFVRASELALGKEDEFVVLSAGKPTAVRPNDTKTPIHGDLFASYGRDGLQAKTSFALFAELAQKTSLETYANRCGVAKDEIVRLAREFTSHGKRAVAEFYRGAVKHTDGYYQAQAIISLNLLLGNADWKGGLSKGGGHWHEFGGKPGNLFDFKKLNAGALKTFGMPISREAWAYEETTLFGGKGYPARRPFYPYSNNIYQEVIPSGAEGYPYQAKVLLLHKGTPALSTPAGHKFIDLLRDTTKIPLFISCDIVLGETTMYADYVFPDLTYLERWGTPHVTPDVQTKASKVRQPVVEPLTESVTIDGEEMPICMEALLIALGKRLGLSGFGRDAFGAGEHFNRPEDFYLKAVANIAHGDKPGEAVPEASDEELALFQKARRHLPKSVFDEAQWRRAVAGDEARWRRTVYVLNRGGRFEAADKAYTGDRLTHRYGEMFNFFCEEVALGHNSISGKLFEGFPHPEPPQDAAGKPVKQSGHRFTLLTYKTIHHGQSRTAPPDYWLADLLPENHVLMNAADARKLALKAGDIVRLVSQSNRDGMFDVGDGRRLAVQGKIRPIQGLRPGTISVSWHFGHWAYGSQDVVIDGITIKGDSRRNTGLTTNPVLLTDPLIKNVCLTDPIGGSASFFDTKVNLVKV